MRFFVNFQFVTFRGWALGNHYHKKCDVAYDEISVHRRATFKEMYQPFSEGSATI
jgi:hypothetical protein